MDGAVLLTSHRMLCWVLLLATALLTTCASGLIVNRRMFTPAQCPGKVLAAAYRYRTANARSAVECVSQCRDYNCMSALFDVDNHLCHLGNARAEDDCSNMELAVGKMKYYETEKTFTCENGGQIQPDGQSCSCAEAHYGDTCSNALTDCKAYVDQNMINVGESVNVPVKPQLASEPFDVRCDVLASGNIRTHMFQRKDMAVDFNLTFLEYRDGFGIPGSDTYWIGLEKLHLLTGSKDYEMRVKFVSNSGSSLFQGYWHFLVGDEASGYAVDFTSASPRLTLGDCLTGYQGAKFSTYDVDNDGSASVHCARLHGGGWWFKGDNCSTCNPFGPIIPPFNEVRKGVPGEAFWTNDLGDTIPFPLSATLVDMP